MLLSRYPNAIVRRIYRALWGTRIRHWPSGPGGKRLLHVGCGAINSPEFINVDARRLPHVHIVTRNIFKLHSIPDRAVDFVYMSHVLEHVPRHQVGQTLKEMNRVLKVGGVLRISVPDFDHIVSIYQTTGNRIASIAPALMGGQDYAFNFHYCVFNRSHLSHLLDQAGFDSVTAWDPEQCEFHDFDDWASKKIEIDGRMYPISLNLEARKATS